MIVNPGSILCASFLNVDAGLSCTFVTATNTLTLSNAFPSGKAAGSTFSFSISSILNPLSFAPVTVSFQTMTANGLGIVDTGSATVTATSVATIDSTQTIASADNSTVQTYTNINIQLTNPVPVSTGCIITVVFPS